MENKRTFISNGIAKVKLDPYREMPVIGIRIIDKKYAKDFIENGIIHFSSPQIWRDETITSKDQFDKYEGCFCYSKENNDEYFKSIGRKFKTVMENDAFRYYEEIPRLMGCCFYGINKSSFIPSTTKYGLQEINSLDLKVPKTFFDCFDDRKTEDKSVILIFDIPSFVEKITNSLLAMECDEKDIYYSSVYYVQKNTYYGVNEPFPFEFFLKDNSYKEQSEFRVLINGNNDTFWSLFKNKNFNLEIGDISKIARIEDNYQSDLFFSIQENYLLYNLATPITTNIEEMPFENIVSFLYQTLANCLPGEPISDEEVYTRANRLKEILHKKYGVICNDRWEMYFVPRSQFNKLKIEFQNMCKTIVENR